MKSDIRSFPTFINSLKSDALVYLFGTGISASLTGKSYSWWKWIVDGIHCMKNSALAVAYEDALNKDSSAANMIDIVGKVLTATKADGTYAVWMNTAFESNSITNFPLSGTLKKLLITQDVIATTNYDLLLEQATGLSTLSYEEPDVAFSMLDRHISTHVLHIHGVYDSVNGRDNIVADEAQYDLVMADQGAQFIQGILGTRTIIFVGCGKTTEDANITRLIQFANEHLKMNQTYFFLYNARNPVDGLPDNFVPIPYGDEYSDLPGFLEDMVQIRIKSRIESNSIIGRTAQETVPETVDSLAKYHYLQRAIPFCGRKQQMNDLQAFVNVEQDFAWWSVTGQAGAGKSRLALEFLAGLPAGWFGFFVNDKIRQKDLESFVPFSNTVIVVDYVAGRERTVAEVMQRCMAVFRESPYRLRILLLERDNSRRNGSWYSTLLQHFGKYEAEDYKNLEYRGESLNLGDLDEADVEAFIGEACKRVGLEEDSERNRELRIAYGQKFEHLQYRPLFVQMFVEAWVENGFAIPRYDNFEDILRQILQREQERWLASVEGDQAVCNSFIRLLLRANISGRMDIREIPEYYKEDWNRVERFISDNSFPGMQRRERRQSLINGGCQDINENEAVIAPLFPDIIKEYMFCYYMEENRLPGMMNEIWQNCAADFSVFITRCMTDFPEQEFYKRALNQYEASTDDLHVLSGRLELLKKWIIQDNDDPLVLLDIIQNEYEFWRAVVIPEEDSEKTDMLAVLKISGLNMVARQFGGWAFYDVSDMVQAAEEALQVKGGKAAELMKQFFLQGHITELSKAGFLEEAAYLRTRMEELLPKEEEDEWSALLKMQNMNSEMMEYLLCGNMEGACRILRQMTERCKYSSLDATRMLAHSGFNFDNFAFMLHRKEYMGRGLLVARKAELLYPDDWTVRARRLGCQGSALQLKYFGSDGIFGEELRTELEKMNRELDTMSFVKEISDEALGITWGMLKTLWVNVMDTEDELRGLISETNQILAVNPDVAEAAATKAAAVHALHKKVLKTKVSHAEIEDLFRHVERNYTSASLRNAFFEMLEDSEDAAKRENYMTKWVTYGARQDAKYNPIMGSGIDEIDEEADFLRYLSECEQQEPYRREHRKVGANEPCPCGSGRKFKKCCRGKGLYD